MTLHPDMTVDHFTFTIMTGWNMSALFPFFLSERAKYFFVQLTWGDYRDTYHQRQQPILKLLCYGKFKSL